MKCWDCKEDARVIIETTNRQYKIGLCKTHARARWNDCKDIGHWIVNAPFDHDDIMEEIEGIKKVD